MAPVKGKWEEDQQLKMAGLYPFCSEEPNYDTREAISSVTAYSPSLPCREDLNKTHPGESVL